MSLQTPARTDLGGEGVEASSSDRLARYIARAELILVPLGAILVSLVIFGLFVAALGVNPFAVCFSIYKGAFGSWFSWQNTLQRAAPLILTALCTAIPARLGLIVIGGEGAFVVGALGAVAAAVLLAGMPYAVGIAGMMLAAILMGGLWIGFAGALRVYRGVNETISSLLLNYIAIALMNHLISGVMRDPTVVHRPSSWSIGEAFAIGKLPGMNVHWGLAVGVIACIFAYILMRHTTFGFAARIVGGNPRAAAIVGLPIGRLVITACFLGGAAAGLAGMIEVAAGEGRVSSSIVVGYGYTGILIAFIARQNPLAVVPAAILLGGIRASGGLLQRWHDLPDASVLVLQGIMFIMILVSEPVYARMKRHATKAIRHG